jgi:hypothetical protein
VLVILVSSTPERISQNREGLSGAHKNQRRKMTEVAFKRTMRISAFAFFPSGVYTGFEISAWFSF